jgi:hypothetical protein
MSSILLRSVPLDNLRFVEAASHINYFSMHLLHVLVPAVLLLGLLGAWPAWSIKEFTVRLSLGALAAVGVLGAVVPLTLAGKFSLWLVDTTARSPTPFQGDWLIHLLIFSEMGGRWLIPIVVGIACIGIARFVTSRWVVCSSESNQTAISSTLTRRKIE